METETTSECLSEPMLLRYVSGELSAGEVRSAELHLDVCGDCLGVVAVLGGSRAEGGPQGEDHGTRYVLGEQIARGGMGRILAAWDRTLDRPVVLKTVRASDALSRERFAREMVVTARLQHPAIVPVYDGGRFEDGTPFYAMRRVDGRELEACIVQAESLRERLELARPYIALVDAVAYAHAEKFVHRDLKPRNVLVGPFGETVVLDWGLAKRLDEASQIEPETLTGDRPEPGLTSTGAVMGTPGYIAPEIAQGEPASPRSDVYSLGVILARILTGEPPERATRLDDVAVVGAPADLVAIARRATEGDPRARYADASDLAEDLRRFEAGRRVAARTYGILDRLVRFVRRHRAAASVAGVAAVSLLAFGGWSYRNVSAARARTGAALEEARGQRAIAEQEREAAEKLTDFALEDLSKELERAGQEELLTGLIGEVDEYYAGRGRPDDPTWAFRRARALEIKATIDTTAGRADPAETGDSAALELLAVAARDPKLAPDADLLRCEIFRRRAMFLRNRKDLDAASSAASECIAITERYLADDPDNRRWRLSQAAAEIARVLVVLDEGDSKAAEPAMTKLLAGLEKVEWEGEYEGEVTNLRRIVDGRLGSIAIRDERPDEALEYLERALEGSERLRSLRPRNVAAIKAVAGARIELCAVLRQLGRLEEAQKHVELAISTLEMLLELEPEQVNWAQNLSLSRRELTAIHLSRDQPEQAVASSRANVAGMRALAARVPDSHQIALDLGFILVDLGDALGRAGRADEAAAQFEEGLDRIETVVAEEPGNALALRKLAFARLLHGDFELQRSNLEPAATSLSRARELTRRELEKQPSPGNRLRFAEPTARLVVIRWRQRDVDQARELLREVREEIAKARAEGADSKLAEQLLAVVEEPARGLGVEL